MTIIEKIAEIDRLISRLEKEDLIRVAVLDTVQKQAERIFSNGLKSDSSKIGTYNNTKEIWVSQEDAPKKVNNRGKPNKDGKRKKIKGGYYESYKKFREAMGREASFVNIRLTNDLQSDFSNSPVSKSSNALAKAKPIKVNKNEYKVSLKRDINIAKKEGLEKKYGKIFSLTKDEKKNFHTIAEKEFNLFIKRLKGA